MKTTSLITGCCALALGLSIGACTNNEPPAPKPVITRLSPTRGAADSAVVITGRHLTGATFVTFGSQSLGCHVLNDTTLATGVPSRLSPDTVMVNVTTKAGASNSLPFRVTATPELPELLSRNAWRLQYESGYNPYLLNPTVEENLLAQRPACFQDNILRFELPNRVILDEGPTRCAPTDPQTYVGTWSLSTVPGIPYRQLTLTGIPGFPTANITVNCQASGPITGLPSGSQLVLSYPDSSRAPGYRVTRIYTSE